MDNHLKTYEQIQIRVRNTKFLINRDHLIIPSEKEEAIAKLVISYIIKNNDYKISNLKESTLEIAMRKVMINLKKYFQSPDIEKKYENLVLTRDIIEQCTEPQEYYTTFRGSQIPWNINIPYKLDELSHIYIGHEVMHTLLNNKNFEEWKNLLLYSEVIPMLYEFLQVSDENKFIKQNILKLRLSKLLEMQKDFFNEEIMELLKNDYQTLFYFQIDAKSYFISFYYTVLLYQLYIQDPKEILSMLKDALKQEITTEQMLENLGLLKKVDNISFEKGYTLILKNNL